MKKILFSVALLSAGMMLSSCNDKLDVEQKATSSTGNFYKTDADAESAVTAMYATYIGEIGGTEGIWNAYIMGLNYTSDDVFSAGGDINDHADFRVLDEFRYDTSSGPISTLYNHIYKAIYSANLVINYFDGDLADTPLKKQAVAEAKVMRAWAHMLAAQVYYRPPLVDHLITTEKPTNAESQKAIFDFCVKDCEEAINNLPDRKGQTDKEGAWRVTKGFAQFVGGKAALFAGDNAKAASLLKPLVESSNYALVPGNRFRDLFHIEGDGCEEKIFEFNYTTNTSLGGVWGGSIQRGRWMVANVLNWRGDDIQGGGKNPQICSTGGWGGGAINQDFAHKMLANDGDSYRRKATFLTSDEFFYDETLCGWRSDATCTTRAQKEFDPERGITKSAGSFSRSDVMEVKMMCHPKDVDLSVGDNCNNTNLCIARLGEAYLLYAEACLATGNNAEAKKYINLIQQRAGSKTISDNVDMQVLMDEKQYELWFEGCRWFDIVRWGIAKECYDKVLDNIPLQWDEYFQSGGTKPHKLVYKVHHPWADAGVKLEFVKNKNEYWPIPQTVVEVNDQMHQVWGAWAN
ncbi:Starch-binding associating with outer membrane [Prevotella sp. ne3005]|uniref:RagB/SusD family nutrient uptake outer membrane protein n=1 Tax=Prevotella sp. ne3005 TaxID=1761887 RepID=UPI0008D33348|nr:RagB/SusD family nutrient uptake outer membrane protein [Prevotella sp. ne3005]SEM76956.1 Starch-binding associating with outer membrane [Prevotella sp. ne3005]